MVAAEGVERVAFAGAAATFIIYGVIQLARTLYVYQGEQATAAAADLLIARHSLVTAMGVALAIAACLV